MDNILDYIKWRGDLSFSERKFNEVDNLILAQLTYIDLSGIVPETSSESITLKEAANLVFTQDRENTFRIRSFSSIDPSFLKEAAHCERFQNVRLLNYSDICDGTQNIQFAAMSFELDDGTVYVGFRGTDQTITGWRENFTMSFQITPAQRKGVEYLEQAMSENYKNFRVGGHSKGGNLAVYSAMMCKDQFKDRIIQIYDNDGPGFCKEMLQTDQYKKIQDKIISIVPEFSVIGMLFEHDVKRRIAKSSSNGIMQHDAMSWVVKGDCFEETGELTSECKKINQIFDSWIENVDMDQRRTFTNDFFNALESGGAKQIDEIANGGVRGFEPILTAIINSEQKTKKTVGQLAKTVIINLRQINYFQLLKSQNTIKGICTALVGLFFMKLPDYSLQIIASIAIFIIFCFAAKRLIHHIINQTYQENFRKYSIIFYAAVMILLLLLIWNGRILLFSANISLGIALVVYGFLMINQAMRLFRNINKLRIVSYVLGFLSIILGIVALVASGEVMDTYIFAVGVFLIITGLYEIIAEMYKSSFKHEIKG